MQDPLAQAGSDSILPDNALAASNDPIPDKKGRRFLRNPPPLEVHESKSRAGQDYQTVCPVSRRPGGNPRGCTPHGAEGFAPRLRRG